MLPHSIGCIRTTRPRCRGFFYVDQGWHRWTRRERVHLYDGVERDVRTWGRGRVRDHRTELRIIASRRRNERKKWSDKGIEGTDVVNRLNDIGPQRERVRTTLVKAAGHSVNWFSATPRAIGVSPFLPFTPDFHPRRYTSSQAFLSFPSPVSPPFALVMRLVSEFTI